MSQLISKIFKDMKYIKSSSFGMRDTEFHDGTDYATYGCKIPQYAVESGYVDSTEVDSYGALCVWIKYPRLNKKMLHCHLDRICVKEGENVNNNTIVGYTGNTGYVVPEPTSSEPNSGIHLHLGLMDLDTEQYEDVEIYVIP